MLLHKLTQLLKNLFKSPVGDLRHRLRRGALILLPHLMVWGSQGSYPAIHRLTYYHFLFSGPSKGEDIPPVLIKPVCNPFCFWSEKLKLFLWCGVQHDSLEVRAWTHQLGPAVAQEQWEHRHVPTWWQVLSAEPTSWFELKKGMLHKHHRLEMRSAKPVISYLFFPFPSNTATQALQKQTALRKARSSWNRVWPPSPCPPCSSSGVGTKLGFTH